MLVSTRNINEYLTQRAREREHNIFDPELNRITNQNFDQILYTDHSRGLCKGAKV